MLLYDIICDVFGMFLENDETMLYRHLCRGQRLLGSIIPFGRPFVARLAAKPCKAPLAGHWAHGKITG